MGQVMQQQKGEDGALAAAKSIGFRGHFRVSTRGLALGFLGR